MIIVQHISLLKSLSFVGKTVSIITGDIFIQFWNQQK